MSKPTILLVPGSFSPSGLFYNDLATNLRAQSYDVIAVELLTVSPPSTSPAKSMEDDAAWIRGIAESLINDGKDVVIAMNSYGGIPGTQAVQGFGKKERQSQGKSGGITGLVYLTALLVNPGESLGESLAAGAGVPDYVKVQGEYMWLEPEGNATYTFSDLPRDKGIALAKCMPGHSARSFGEKLTSTSHYDIPITYVKCTKDQVIPPSHQQKMIDDMKKVTRSSVDVVEIACGHCPMVTAVDDTAKAIVKAATG